MRVTLRVCLDCGALSEQSRCLAHRRGKEQARGSAAARGYDARYRRLRKAVIEAHVARFGWTCPGFNRPAHPVAPEGLTADHVQPLSRGGESTRANLAGLCLSCNVSKRDGRDGGRGVARLSGADGVASPWPRPLAASTGFKVATDTGLLVY
jgi:5-methylcytosine-specific restriction enzyme A